MSRRPRRLRTGMARVFLAAGPPAAAFGLVLVALLATRPYCERPADDPPRPGIGYLAGATSVRYSQDGARLYAAIAAQQPQGLADVERLVVACDADGRRVGVLAQGSDVPGRLALSPDGRLLAGPSGAGVPASAPFDRGVGLCVSQDGSRIAYLRAGSAREASSIRVVHVGSPAPPRIYPIPAQYPADTRVRELAISPDNRLLACAMSRVCYILDMQSGAVVTMVSGFRDSDWGRDIPRPLTFSADGHKLAAGFLDGQVKVYDLGTGLPCHVFDGDAGQVTSLAFSPDGSRLAVVRGLRDVEVHRLR